MTFLLDYKKICSHLGIYFLINIFLSLPGFSNYAAYTGYVCFINNKTSTGVNTGWTNCVVSIGNV